MNNICTFDFETDSTNPEICSPTQIACVMINPYKLEVIEGSEFFSKVRPLDIDKDDYLDQKRLETIKFHCRNRNITQEELLEEWKKSPHLDIVWKQFENHINKYNKGGTSYGAPWPSGANIINFDLPIAERLNNKYKVKKMFGHEVIDLRHLFLFWLVWDSSQRSRSMDNMCKYMGISDEDAHNALRDVRVSAKMVIKFLQLHKTLYPRIKFRNCFVEEVGV